MNAHLIIFFKFFLCFALTIALPACASAPNIPLRQQTLQSELMTRSWHSKSFSVREPAGLISVITSDDLSGDIVILRWDDEKRQFKAEVYRQEDKPGRQSWLFREGNMSKTLNQQPNGEFFISDIIEGKEGGQRVEVFRLSAPESRPPPS